MVIFVAALGACVWLVFAGRVADADPVGILGLILGVISVIISIWSGYIGLQSLILARADLGSQASALADKILSIESTALLHLVGKTSARINLRFTLQYWQPLNAMNAGASGVLNEVDAYYRNLDPGRLVITGRSGSGKTVLATQLTAKLLETRAVGEPIPIRLAITRWDTNQPLDQWLIAELITASRVHPQVAARLVHEGWIVPVLDGLDEMDSISSSGPQSRAVMAINEINDFWVKGERAPVIVTSLDDKYKSLIVPTKGVLESAHVEVEEINATEAWDFMSDRVIDMERWEPVLDTLASYPNGMLAKELSSPWRLTVARVVYEQHGQDGSYPHDPAELLSFASPQEIQDHLMRLFVPGTVSTLPPSLATSYEPALVLRWLRALASYLETNVETGRRMEGRVLSGSDLILHELWPLAGRKPWMLGNLVLGMLALLALPALGMIADRYNTPPWPFLAICTLIAFASSGPAFVWSEPAKASLGSFRSTGGRLRLIAGFTIPALIGVGISVTASRQAAISIPGPAVLITGLAFGLLGVIFFSIGTDATVRVQDPRDPIRGDTAFAIIISLMVALMAGGAFLLVAGPEVGLLAGVIALGLGVPVCEIAPRPVGQASLRYLMLILCTRGRLPWRLGRFLNWAYNAGLVRKAGVAYQFRHRELQEWLARQ